jgi:hypothetical protein
MVERGVIMGNLNKTDNQLPKYNSKCFFLSEDKKSCNALKNVSCDNCKFFKNKKHHEELAETLYFLKTKKLVFK